MRAVGLTGGIASGKTTVSAILAELGATVIDADVLGHKTYEPGTDTHEAVVQAFGDAVVAEDGSIDRRALGGMVFGKPDELRRLTDIVWPGIRALAQTELETLATSGVEVAVLEAAVMIEAGWQDLVDEVWVIEVPAEVARQRLMDRNQMSAEDAERRIESQLSNAERKAHADLVISTDCTLDEVRTRVVAAWETLRERRPATS